MPGPSHDDAGTVVVVGRVVAVVAVVVVLVEDVVAPAAVVVEVDEVEVDVVVVGVIGSEQDVRQRRATLFCWPMLSFVQLQSSMLRKACRRQLRSSFFWIVRHFFTHPYVIVQRPPAVERQRGLFAIAPMQSSKEDFAIDRQSR
jgi:hypothetical protein